MALKKIDSKFVTEQWDEGTTRRQAIDNEILQNFAFLYDEHYARFDKAFQGFQRPADDGRVRLTINYIKSIWRSEMGRLLANKVIPEVVAASPEERDRNVSKIGNRIMAHELDRLHFERFRGELYSWVTSAGFAFAHPHWDKDGDNVALDLVTPGELVRDPSARYHVNDGMWVIHGKVLTVEDAYEKFGREFPGSGDSSRRVLNLANLVGGWRYGGNPVDVEGVLVLRLWHKPCRNYPAGMVLTVVGGEEVERIEEYPYDHGRLPFVDFHSIRLPGRFEGQSSVRGLWGPQRNLNDAVSRRAEARQFFSYPHLMALKDQMDSERLDTTPGAIWYYRQVGMHKPEVAQMGAPPSFLFDEADAAYQQMQEIASRREISKGQVPASGVPALAVQMLQEADNTALAPIAASLDAGIAQIGKQILALCKQFWLRPRTLAAWSEETGKITVDQFKGADLEGSYDVRVEPGASLPRSKSQRRADILSLWDRRIIQDPQTALQQMDMPGFEGVLYEMDQIARHAQREHERMYERATQGGDEVLPETWHDHDMHIAKHNAFRYTEEFEVWPPEAKADLDQHVQMHEQQRQEKMMQQAEEMAAQQQMMAPPGGPPGAQNTLPGVNAPDQGPLPPGQPAPGPPGGPPGGEPPQE